VTNVWVRDARRALQASVLQSSLSGPDDRRTASFALATGRSWSGLSAGRQDCAASAASPLAALFRERSISARYRRGTFYGVSPAREGDFPLRWFRTRSRRVSLRRFFGGQFGLGRVWPFVWLPPVELSKEWVPCDDATAPPAQLGPTYPLTREQIQNHQRPMKVPPKNRRRDHAPEGTRARTACLREFTRHPLEGE